MTICRGPRRALAVHSGAFPARLKRFHVRPASPRCEPLLPDDRVRTDPGDLEHYGRDWTRQYPPAPLAVALPESVEEVQALVRWASGAGVALVPSGGRTGLSGGAVAMHGELVVSLRAHEPDPRFRSRRPHPDRRRPAW